METHTRMLDHGTPPERFARGWHCLGLADSFRDGMPHRIEAFGGQLVVWEDTQGNINALDGYCRHMGGDLTQGTVKGDEVACPFHDWRWGGAGQGKRPPYARRGLGRPRQVEVDPVPPAGAAAAAHPEVPGPGPQRPGAGRARRRGLRGG